MYSILKSSPPHTPPCRDPESRLCWRSSQTYSIACGTRSIGRIGLRTPLFHQQGFSTASGAEETAFCILSLHFVLMCVHVFGRLSRGIVTFVPPASAPRSAGRHRIGLGVDAGFRLLGPRRYMQFVVCGRRGIGYFLSVTYMYYVLLLGCACSSHLVRACG